MRDFFQLLNEYPWTSFFVFFGSGCLINDVLKALANIFACRCRKGDKDNEKGQ